jgi:[acyl-carrier-protein] S-malonyltransferase
MARAGQANPGRMAAVLGLDVHRVAQACERSGAQIANLNAPGQVVISGSAEGVQRASELARAAGARRVVGLAVSVAAHSRLMQPVADEFARHVRATPIQPARVPVIANATASVIQTPEAITAELCGQLTQPVCWVESIEAMLALGVSTFIEIGSGDVLTGLVRRIADHGVTALSLERPAAMDELRKLERQV